ncbi:uncharacterized protein LOC142497840 isoform X2 [Ascaphus truei]|uniref:uncharacterized protein LOC142497840 isoform X2 n=1 Tax=Ascaphus truei TaxID=8439 RepID=UPI003F5AB4D3
MLHRALIILSLALVLPMMLLTSAGVTPPVNPVSIPDKIEASFGGGHGPVVPEGRCGINERFYLRCRPCPECCGGDRISCNPDQCQPGCGCKEGYVLEHYESKRCIPGRDCAQCTSNERFVACYRPCEEPGCGDNESSNKPRCVEPCRPGCQCERYHVRYDGKCIDPKWCEN